MPVNLGWECGALRRPSRLFSTCFPVEPHELSDSMSLIHVTTGLYPPGRQGHPSGSSPSAQNVEEHCFSTVGGRDLEWQEGQWCGSVLWSSLRHGGLKWTWEARAWGHCGAWPDR